MELICVTFNCPDDWNVHLNLFDYFYKNYENKLIMKSGIIDINSLFYEATPYLPFDIYYPLKENEVIKIVIYLLKNPNEIIIGKVAIFKGNELVLKKDIYRYY